jgi:hypothetical protein
MKVFLLLFIMICFYSQLSAQQVIATSGTTLSNASGSISFTLGEGVAQTLSKGDKVLTQGFQQSSIAVSLVSEVKDLGYHITAYPNPARDFVKLNIENDNLDGFEYLLFNLTGQLVKREAIQNTITDIPMNYLTAGSYILKVKSGGSEIITFKIIKL